MTFYCFYCSTSFYFMKEKLAPFLAFGVAKAKKSRYNKEKRIVLRRAAGGCAQILEGMVIET